MACIYIPVTEKFPTSTPYHQPLTATTPESGRNSSENKESSRSPPSSHTLSLSLSLSLSLPLFLSLLLRYTCTPIYNEGECEVWVSCEIVRKIKRLTANLEIFIVLSAFCLLLLFFTWFLLYNVHVHPSVRNAYNKALERI